MHHDNATNFFGPFSGSCKENVQNHTVDFADYIFHCDRFSKLINRSKEVENEKAERAAMINTLDFLTYQEKFLTRVSL